ncbi:PH domain-containing protein [Rhodohalobacter halophilus]|uniref:PH domain-containing protein n=1 Tax=Rhodohalobacter halophilus TaxID=1812810 RepID=UPI00083F5A5C|nr:PH domain-containing protein [Rhodohalobacter halophilus]
MKKTPFHKLPPRAIRVWQWSNALGNLFFLGIPVVYYAVFGMNTFHFWILAVSTVLILSFWILSFTLMPTLIWKNWRYAVDSDEIDLKRGVIVKNRTLIPLSRVQHVDTRQGPILRWYKLATVTISTAATTHEIPALDEVLADRVRDQISKYARLAEEDV